MRENLPQLPHKNSNETHVKFEFSANWREKSCENLNEINAKFEFGAKTRHSPRQIQREKQRQTPRHSPPRSPAFTLIELVFVIVIAGLLAAIIAPRFAQNKPLAAAQQLAAHIRYAQHLALTHDRFNATRSDWQRTWWIVEFSHINTQRKVAGVCENVQCWRYNVYADDTGSTNLNSIRQAAPDPLAPGKRLTAGFSPGSMTAEALAALNLRLNLTHTYGVERVLFRGGCTTYGGKDDIGLKLRFDELGRVYGANVRKAYDGALTQACNVLLYGGGGQCARVVIEAQTGFVRVAEGC